MDSVSPVCGILVFFLILRVVFCPIVATGPLIKKKNTLHPTTKFKLIFYLGPIPAPDVPAWPGGQTIHQASAIARVCLHQWVNLLQMSAGAGRRGAKWPA